MIESEIKDSLDKIMNEVNAMLVFSTSEELMRLIKTLEKAIVDARLIILDDRSSIK